jgi:hypothetical protein
MFWELAGKVWKRDRTKRVGSTGAIHGQAKILVSWHKQQPACGTFEDAVSIHVAAMEMIGETVCFA